MNEQRNDEIKVDGCLVASASLSFEEKPAEAKPTETKPEESSDPLGIPLTQPITPVDLNSRHLEYNEVFEDTLYFVKGIVEEYRFYPEILSMIKSGKTTVSMGRSIVKKQISSDWVSAIEDCLPHLDKIVRNPSRIIEQNEEVLPIELSRHINSRSIQHLGQHTDYINSIDEDGTITPSKILNVFNDETINTYENRFVNTLLMRLFIFVSKRFSKMFAAEHLENKARLEFLTEFESGATHGKMSFGIEVSDPADSADAVPGEFSLSDRVRRLNDIVSAYQSSALVKQLGRSYIRPPVMRTNAIMKNKDLKQCLLLWQFIESYEDIGVKIEHEEKALKPDEKYLDELYSTLALQYVIFKYNTGALADEKNMTPRQVDKIIREPEYVFDVPEIEEENYTVYDSEYRKFVNVDSPIGKRPFSEDELRIKQAIEAALIADEFYRYPEEDEDADIDPADIFTAPDGRKIRVRYRKSFRAKLIQSSDKTKGYYGEIKNYLLAYSGMKNKISWSHERFYIGRHSYAKFAIAGKTLNVYLSLDPAELENSKYIYTDASEIKKYSDTPVRLKIRSDRACKWAKELIAVMMAKDGVTQGEISRLLPEIPYEDKLPLIARGLIHIIGTDLADGSTVSEEELKKLMGIASEEDESDPEQAPAEEKPIEEKPTEEVPVEENPEEQRAEDEDTPDSFALYRRSFRAKLIQSEDEVKGYYVAVRAHLFGYGMKCSDSWDNETYRIGRKHYAKIGINGKTLILFLALDPKGLEGTKYFFEDVSDRKKYERTPLKFKIRSDRAVAWAIELIDMMAEADALTFKQIPAEQIPPFEATQPLIDRGLIRVNKEMLDKLGSSLTPEPVPVTVAEEKDKQLPPIPEEYSEMRSDGILEEQELKEAPRDRDEQKESRAEGEEAVTVAREEPRKYIPEGEPVEQAASEAVEESFSGMYIRRSFKGKLHQADEELKNYYTEIRNKLMSYPKMKCSDSWDNETFHFERSRYARLALSGKTLALYLALDPEEYQGTKYFFTDSSAVKKYERTPMKLRIRTKRSVLWAMELIEDMAKLYSFGAPSDRTEKYDLPFKGDLTLYDEGMARIDEGLLAIACESGDEGALAMRRHMRGEDILPVAEDASFKESRGMPVLRYRKSFEAKLIMAPEHTKQYYMQIRNALLSYKRVGAYGSFVCESYRRGRLHLAKLAIAGKTLNLYLAIDPETLVGTKYRFEDSSERRRYSRVPLRLKIRSDRACRWACELIAKMMDEKQIPRGSVSEEYFDIPEESFDSLLERGLIKVAVTVTEDKGKPVEAPKEQPQIDEAPAEEAPVEETPVEEAPAEEAPAEEAPAEEAPAEEAPAEEAPAEAAPDDEDEDDSEDESEDDGGEGRGFMAHFRRIFGRGGKK